ncbi:MAG: DUF4384 domain-containing protein [Gammaproteobacteria bacterium]|nr:DUF4384 domain-containing protein [Gammaproteobacteria bacterium]
MTKRLRINFTFYVLIGFMVFVVFSSNSNAQSPVGIITNMEGDVSILNDNNRSADFGDDVIFNDKMKIGANSSLVLTYYTGCRQEWFGENTVIEVGEDNSKVISGKLEKSEVFDCEVPEVVLSDKDSFKKAAFHFRGVTPVKTPANKETAQQMKNDKSKSRRINVQEVQDGDVKLRIWTAKKDDMYYRSGEHIIIYFIADKDAYLKLDYFQADGNVVHLIPNLFEEKHKIKAGQIYVVGGNKSKLKLIVEHPYGEESIRAIVSQSPLEGEFKSPEIIEKSHDYEQKMKNILMDNKQTKVAEYALDIWSIP